MMSSNPSHCRLIVHGPGEGAWNMAVDEALLESAADGGGLTLRFYQWREATLSLGYFQAHAERQTHAASRDCPLVRRQTGGGAIVHDRELTYSLCAPPAHPLAGDTQALYDHWHGSLIQALAQAGVPATLCGQASGLAKAEEPFLCFQRRAVGDVLLDDFKITGSAQRRWHGAVLQHGSILLAQSAAAPELPGIAELRQTHLSSEQLVVNWVTLLQTQLGLEFAESDLSSAEQARAAQIKADKYAAAAWNERR